MRQGRGICSPLVEVEVCGIDSDWAKFKTSTCSELKPPWFRNSQPELHVPDPPSFFLMRTWYSMTVTKAKEPGNEVFCDKSWGGAGEIWLCTVCVQE